jgi:formamidopyrimidine-DNA glycosylase
MPELPEVETIVRDLRKKILNKEIVKVDIKLKKIVKNSNKVFISTLQKNTIKDIRRRGKLLIFGLSKNDRYLIIHLKMTGQLVYKKGNRIIGGGHEQQNIVNSVPNKYSHVRIHFIDQSILFFNDIRQFGFLKIVNKVELEKYLLNYGLEPLSRDFNIGSFRELIKGKKTNIKAFLLNQKNITGLGNIYVDESLFLAGIKPNRSVNKINDLEIEKLFKAIKDILKRAVKYRGTTFNNYVDADGHSGNFVKKLKVYQREGQLCLRCKEGVIEKTRIAGRGTRYCSQCQN